MIVIIIDNNTNTSNRVYYNHGDTNSSGIQAFPEGAFLYAPIMNNNYYEQLWQQKINLYQLVQSIKLDL